MTRLWPWMWIVLALGLHLYQFSDILRPMAARVGIG